MIIADLLDMMGTVDNEASVATGGSDEVRSITALWMATKYLESVAASIPKVLGQASGIGLNPPNANILTVANQEASVLPSSLLRVDSLWAIDSTTKLPLFEMVNIHEVGGHYPSLPAPWGWAYGLSTGRPWGYYQDSQYLFWRPLPDAVYQVRAYGLWARAVKYPNRDAPFPYPDDLALPVALFATRYTTMAIDDPSDEVKAAAVEAFTPALRALRRRNRQGPTPKEYTRVHVT